jgi:hypothetical protein
MANYVEVADVEQLPPGRGTVVTVEGKDVALFNVDGTIYASRMLVFTTECHSELRNWRARSSPVEDTDGNMMSPLGARTLSQELESPLTL